MRVFFTGATGFIGSAVIRELLDSGHRVLGLARSDASAAALQAVGAEAHRGALDDVDSLRRGAAAADGVVHTAWIQNFSDMAGSAAVDLRAIEAMGEALEGSGRPLVITSGVAALPAGRLSTEDDDLEQAWGRAAAEAAALALAERGVRTSVVRPAPSVHGPCDTGFVATMVAAAREHGRSATSGTARTGGLRWLGPTPHTSTVWPLTPLLREHGCMRSESRGCRSGRSLRRSVVGSTCRSSASPVTTPPTTSGSPPPSPHWTSWPPTP